MKIKKLNKKAIIWITIVVSIIIIVAGTLGGILGDPTISGYSRLTQNFSLSSNDKEVDSSLETIWSKDNEIIVLTDYRKEQTYTLNFIDFDTNEIFVSSESIVEDLFGEDSYKSDKYITARILKGKEGISAKFGEEKDFEGDVVLQYSKADDNEDYKVKFSYKFVGSLDPSAKIEGSLLSLQITDFTIYKKSSESSKLSLKEPEDDRDDPYNTILFQRPGLRLERSTPPKEEPEDE